MAGHSKGTPKRDAAKKKEASDPNSLTRSKKGAEIELTEEELKTETGASAKKLI
ncbi:MAG TPA: hypothetical protein VN823_28325 [Stellaceae bacterium]|nr:hypothetical protein [Stellaceae bacterium]